MEKPKLQLALDLFQNMGQAKQCLEDVADVVDIIEIGTPLIIREGIKAVTEVKTLYPDLQVLADLKIVDAGSLEAQIAFDAGADIVTVLGVAHNVTIQSALGQAQKYGRQVMVDLITIDDVQSRVQELEEMGVDIICVHTASDVQEQGSDPLKDLQLVQRVKKAVKIAVAGGIKPATLPKILPYSPNVIIVGSFITNNQNYRHAALEIHQLLQ